MSIKICSLAWEHSPAEGTALLMHLALADHANDQGLCWPSMATLAKKCRVSMTSAHRLVHELSTLGLVEVVEPGGGKGHPNLYRISPHPGFFSTSPQVSPQATDRVPPAVRFEASNHATPDPNHTTQVGNYTRAVVEEPLRTLNSPEPSEREAEALQLLASLGLDVVSAIDICHRFRLEKIKTYAEWADAGAKMGILKSPAGWLKRAIENDWPAPRGMQVEHERSYTGGRFGDAVDH